MRLRGILSSGFESYTTDINKIDKEMTELWPPPLESLPCLLFQCVFCISDTLMSWLFKRDNFLSMHLSASGVMLCEIHLYCYLVSLYLPLLPSPWNRKFIHMDFCRISWQWGKGCYNVVLMVVHIIFAAIDGMLELFKLLWEIYFKLPIVCPFCLHLVIVSLCTWLAALQVSGGVAAAVHL